MIITTDKSSAVTTSAGLAPSSFKIKASAKAFKILSGFYSEPLLAIPRELGANAWDSHVASGNTEQMFEVHAPNQLEPFFSLRDFGLGLSPDAIEKIYTTYFESTKTGDNDSDGCMGLGSKTPFNYTENFSVTSWFEGVRYVYNCFINQDGVPSILKFGEENSGEPNGVEIKFAVQQKDISMFVEKIRQAYAPFRFKPVIKGATIVYPEIKYSFKGKEWALRQATNSYSSNHTSYAFMGNYSYPINASALFDGDRYSDKNYNLVTQILSGGLELYFNIGDLEVAPNKEALQYDANKKTQHAIIEACKKAHKELVQLVNDSIEKPKSYWDAMGLHRKYNQYGSDYYTVQRLVGGLTIKYGKLTIDSHDISVSDIHEKSGLMAQIPKDKKFWEHFGSYSVEQYKYKNHTHQLRKDTKSQYTNTEVGALFFYTAEDAVKRARVRAYLETNYPNGRYPTIHIIFDKSPGCSTFLEHKKFLGLEDAVTLHIESLPKPVRAPQAARVAKTDEIHYYNLERQYWSTTKLDVDASNTYYYVDFCYNNHQYTENNVSESTTKAVLDYGVEKGLFKPESIYGINRKNKFLLEVGTWVNIFDAVSDSIKKNSSDLAHQLYLCDDYNEVRNDARLISDKIGRLQFITHLTSQKSIDRFEKLKTLSKAGEFDNGSVEVARFFDVKKKKNATFDDDLTDVVNTINTKYLGLFDILDTYSATGKKIATIINFIDKNS